jgi:hypothetical protein
MRTLGGNTPTPAHSASVSANARQPQAARRPSPALPYQSANRNASPSRLHNLLNNQSLDALSQLQPYLPSPYREHIGRINTITEGTRSLHKIRQHIVAPPEAPSAPRMGRPERRENMVRVLHDYVGNPGPIDRVTSAMARAETARGHANELRRVVRHETTPQHTLQLMQSLMPVSRRAPLQRVNTAMNSAQMIRRLRTLGGSGGLGGGLGNLLSGNGLGSMLSAAGPILQLLNGFRGK